MKNTRKISLILFASACGIFALTGCDDKKSDTEKSATGKSSDASASAGSEAIGFHNSLIDFSKLAREPLKKIVQANKASAEWVSRDGIPGEKPRWNMVLIGINPYNKLAKNKLAAPKSFTKEDQEFFNSRIKIAKDSAAELNTTITKLTAYYKAEDYKDDKHKTFLDLQPRITALVQQVAQATGEMGERSEVIASAAEREALKKNPIGIYILNMRDIMAKCDEQMGYLMDERLVQVGSGTASRTDEEKAASVAKVKDLLDPAAALAKEIAEMAEKFKAVDMAALKNRPSLAKDYEKFFTALEDQQGTVRKNIRFAQEHGYIGTQSSMRLLGGSLRNVTGAHNTFINDVNKGK